MDALWNHHPYAIIAILTFLAVGGLTFANLRGWIRNPVDFLSLLMEVAIVAMIGIELVEGSHQAAILSQLNASASATAGILGTLQQEQEKALQAQKSALTAMGRQTGLLQRTQGNLRAQLGLAKRQMEIAGQRPDLRVWAIIYHYPKPGVPQTFVPQLLTPNMRGGSTADLNLIVQSATRYREADLIIRNVGTAPAINVVVLARASPGVSVACVDYPAFTLYTQGNAASLRPCMLPSDRLQPIPVTPKDYPSPHGLYGSFGATGYSRNDVLARVNLVVPRKISTFQLEVWITADGASPERYLFECHSPNIP